MTDDRRRPAAAAGPDVEVTSASCSADGGHATRRLPVMDPILPLGGTAASTPAVRLPAVGMPTAATPPTAGTPDGVPVIDLADGTKTYATGPSSVQALRGVTLQVDRGEYVAIMGPSGSGKSTLMHILGCLDVLSSGTYRLSGQDVSAMSEVDLAEVRNRRIGFVFQQFNLLASLPAWRNVELPLVYAGVERRVRRERAIAALERVGLADRVEHRPGELSGGQQQRVAVARALVTDPDLVLADEPTGNLDSASTDDILALLGDVHTQGRTVVLITHEADVAAAARRTVRMRDGLIQDDTAVLAGGVR